MLRGIIIAPDQELGDVLEQELFDIGHIAVLRRYDAIPGIGELVRFIRARAPQVIFLNTDDLQPALLLARELEAQVPGLQFIPFGRKCSPDVLLELMRSGLREFLTCPFQRSSIAEAIARAAENVARRPPEIDATDLLYAFLPSKPGVGTSTIAVNASLAMARQAEGKVLLADMDLNSGIISFMLKLNNMYTITDAAERALNMDENLWPQLVSPVGNLDVLHAGRVNVEFRIEAAHIRALIDFARRNYRAISIDLSGNMERYSFEIMHEAKKIFIVCTQELPSLHLARERLQLLRNVDLADRVAILLNRTHRRCTISPSQVEELLGVPVQLALPNDYQGVHKSLTAGKGIDSASELGKQIETLAAAMLDRKPAVSESKRKFVEYFSLLPSRV
ncbi:MAG: CpaE family protein [Bryobacteraceae bacterium]